LRSINSKKEFWGVFSFAFIVILVLVSIFAYVLAPDNSENANQMHLSIHSKPPGFNVNISIPLEETRKRR
jgi:peptide/nickel transport system permease protein